MGYRKMTINDDTYEFAIGKKFTKVKKNGKHFALYENEVIGSPKGCEDEVCGFVITPLNVKHAILELSLPIFECKMHSIKTTNVTCDPYYAEIHNKLYYGVACKLCDNARAGDI